MKPILVVQMQRMGDLILTFPLLLWLRRSFPGHPIQVMAEPQFARPLETLSPEVSFLDAGDVPRLLDEEYALVINLSHRPESHELAGRVRTEMLVGGYSRNAVTRIAGAWQEYRASLVYNNRHNRFHWAELNALDVIGADVMAATMWSPPRSLPRGTRQIGLFLGASEPDKRPAAGFWVGLIRELERRGLTPVLLGGPAERPLCEEVRGLAGRPVASACGLLSLDKFALFGQELAAMVTPDTGPMHLAAWSGLLVLNLSMGPVHAWETGPYQPGHVVLRSSRDCVGCWRCRFDRPRCQDGFIPARVAAVLTAMLGDRSERLAGLRPPGLEIARTGRSKGLYHLDFLAPRRKAGQALGRYWSTFWRHVLGDGPADDCRSAWQELQAGHEDLAGSIRASSLKLLKALTGTGDPRLAVDDWDRLPRAVRPLSSYISVHLANHDFSAASRKRALILSEKHLSFLSVSDF